MTLLPLHLVVNWPVFTILSSYNSQPHKQSYTGLRY